MKILFCSPHPLDATLGAPKVVLEVSREMEKLGWQTTIVGDKEVCPVIDDYIGFKRGFVYSDYLKNFLVKNAKDFDVVDYDQSCLPFARELFHSKTLFAARSVLLIQHFERATIPPMPGLLSKIKYELQTPIRKMRARQASRYGDLTCFAADLVNVSNEDDKIELVRRGINGQKVHVIPFGLTHERFAEFQSLGVKHLPQQPIIVFVGTFDARKGAGDLPKILTQISRSIPDVKLRLLGARYRSSQEIMSYFSENLQNRIELVPEFSPSELPGLLSDCSVGIFPSYLEGFGFGILEMLAAGLPVVAYKVPGPPMMLDGDLLAQAGRTDEFSRKVIDLLVSPEKLKMKMSWAQNRAKDFSWPVFAKLTSEIYREAARLKTSS